MRMVRAASMAKSEYVRCPPGFPLAGARQAWSAASESQTVRSPLLRRPASYSGQFRTRYRDFAYLYWLRFGYFIGDDSGRGFLHPIILPSPEPCTNAAAERAGVTPRWEPIRGGTDGSGLTALGLPTPNIFTGGANFHSKKEWLSVDGLVKSIETLLNIVRIDG